MSTEVSEDADADSRSKTAVDSGAASSKIAELNFVELSLEIDAECAEGVSRPAEITAGELCRELSEARQPSSESVGIFPNQLARDRRQQVEANCAYQDCP